MRRFLELWRLEHKLRPFRRRLPGDPAGGHQTGRNFIGMDPRRRSSSLTIRRVRPLLPRRLAAVDNTQRQQRQEWRRWHPLHQRCHDRMTPCNIRSLIPLPTPSLVTQTRSEKFSRPNLHSPRSTSPCTEVNQRATPTLRRRHHTSTASPRPQPFRRTRALRASMVPRRGLRWGL